MVRMVTVQTQFIFQNCIEPKGTFSQTGSHIWLCRGKNALFTHTIFVATQCTGKQLQGVMCRLSINNMTRAIMPVVAIAFCCVYI